MLLELLSGCKAVDRNEDGWRWIVNVVVPCNVQGEISKALDPIMPITGQLEMMAVADMAYLAVNCFQE